MRAQALPMEWQERRVDKTEEMCRGQREARATPEQSAAPSPSSPGEMLGVGTPTETPGKAQSLCQEIPVWMLPERGQGHLQAIRGETGVSEGRE